MDFELLAGLIREFKIVGEPISISECTNGNINKTYIVETDSTRKYILQRLNENVFKKPDEVIANILHITEFLKGKIADPERGALSLIQALDGGYKISGENGYWRVYNYIDGAVSHDKIEREGQFYNAGYAFGRDGSRRPDQYCQCRLYKGRAPKISDNRVLLRRFRRGYIFR